MRVLYDIGPCLRPAARHWLLAALWAAGSIAVAGCHDWALVRGSPGDAGMDITVQPGCGEQGRACCPERRCANADLSCVLGTCLACGDRERPCCDGNQCHIGMDLVCRAGACVHCGGAGEAC